MSAKPTSAVAPAHFVKQPAHLPDGRIIIYYWFTQPPLPDPEHPQPAAGAVPPAQDRAKQSR